MRINLEYCRDSAECERAWELLKLAASSSSSASLGARILQEAPPVLEVPDHVVHATEASELTNKNTIHKAQAIFLRNNPEFAKTLSPEMRALAIEEIDFGNIPLRRQSSPAWEPIAQALREHPENIAIHSIDGQKISLPFALLPEYFQAMARIEKRPEIETDFDGQTISDYLDYYLGLPIESSTMTLASSNDSAETRPFRAGRKRCSFFQVAG